jgi:phosphoribosylaminoimidazole-succinocarboxamide synthase
MTNDIGRRWPKSSPAAEARQRFSVNSVCYNNAMPTLLESRIPGLPVRRGKVRDVYDLGDKLLLVATDRISAFDWIMPTGIPDKGRILTQLSAFWFQLLGVPNHVLSTDIASLDLPRGCDAGELAGRSTVVRKCRVVPVECVVRGYLEGSGWKEYRASASVCGIRLPPGLVQCSQLPGPIFTPATKEESGHDQNISFEQMVERVGANTANELRHRSIDVYARAAEHALRRGIIIADTKFEWGQPAAGGDELILIDEVLTPDSSRFWPADAYQPGRPQPSFDKQFLREWLETTGWDKNSTPPPLPDEIVARTREKYIEAYERLTGTRFLANEFAA